MPLRRKRGGSIMEDYAWPCINARIGNALISQKSEILWPGGSGTLVRYVLVAALNRARQLRRRLAAVSALLSCACREQTAGVVAADRVKPL